MTSNLIDDTDYRILQYLIEDSTLSHKDIGALVHMTGQAVGARIRRMRELEIIEGYTVRWNPAKIGESLLAFVTVFLSSNAAHPPFQQFAKAHSSVIELHRVSGEGCYWMRVRLRGQEELNAFLDELLEFGNYRVNLGMGQLK
ncbi:transcriptional regulator [Paenibacillus sp. FSL R7-0273]|uniref:Lrp/AsnC family transcriptional regulator n=1 Tax=Paenibacillus sp. FSL R7-0273 TaxID=1536772 RepID=UPI0004F6C7AC|nr:Lrp/AsnC family transcriptional regulator [Paenibacillus sp. FSL R7-0273]AIQ45437.1 transcriptional regulator [Paenibacillus sp. FSL R7-0273]OMF89932.1 transcriptional regulator [Paenibacillus sp. FSL R7-0273]